MEKRSFAVLIIEKDPIVALDLQGILLNMGHDVVASVSDADAAFVAVGRFKPDVVLMGGDITGAKSCDVAEKIIGEFGCPVVFCVFPFEKEILAEVKKITACEVIFKPVNAEALSAIIEMSVSKHELEKSLLLAEERALRATGAVEIWGDLQRKRCAFRWEISGGVFRFDPAFPEDSSARVGQKVSEAVAGLQDGSFSFLLEFPCMPRTPADGADKTEDKNESEIGAFWTAVFGKKGGTRTSGYMILMKKII